MKNQYPAQIAGVTERYVPGVGATPVRRTYRVGSRRAGRSHPRHKGHLASIWHKYESHLRRIQARSIQHPSLIFLRSALDHQHID
jgi:hypothetical protein